MHRATLVTLSLLGALSSQAPSVVSTSPARHAFASAFEAIEVRFALPIAPATVSAHSFAVFGRWTGAVTGALSVDASGTLVSFQPLRPLLVGDVVRVDLANTITSALGAPLAGGYHFEYVVRSAPGSGTFQLAQTIPFRQPSEGWISTYGIHAGDVDRDGTPDITAINEAGHDLRIFRNDGCANWGAPTRVLDGQNWPSPHESADFNGDGWMDLATGDYAFGNVSVFLNNGAGDYLPPLTLPGGYFIRSIGSGDFNGDGWPDLVAGNGGMTLVWLNNGSGGFAAPAFYFAQGSTELGVFDADEDGHLDVVGSDPAQNNCWVMIGAGDGTFSHNANLTPIGASPFQSACGDVNGDGHGDIVFCCQFPDSYRWFFGDGNGNFAFGGSLAAGGWPTSVHLGDLEGDGDLDAVVSHYSSADFYIYSNNGSGGFGAPVILPAVGGASCATIADFDRDGDLDIMGADEIVDVGLFFRQTGPTVAGIQPASCAAALRIEQRADGAGFGGRAPVPVRVGTTMAVSLSGPPNAFPILCVGFPAPASQPLFQWGLLSLDLTMPVTTLVALVPTLDQHGEVHVPFGLPAWVPPGFGLLLQGAVFAPGSELLTNPMQFVLVP